MPTKVTKSEMMRAMMLAFIRKHRRAVQHKEIKAMMRKVVPKETKNFGWYIYHLFSNGKIKRPRRGFYSR